MPGLSSQRNAPLSSNTPGRSPSAERLVEERPGHHPLSEGKKSRNVIAIKGATNMEGDARNGSTRKNIISNSTYDMPAV